jgi:hypothetical protein
VGGLGAKKTDGAWPILFVLIFIVPVVSYLLRCVFVACVLGD